MKTNLLPEQLSHAMVVSAPPTKNPALEQDSIAVNSKII
jgi:hypothetical protein